MMLLTPFDLPFCEFTRKSSVHKNLLFYNITFVTIKHGETSNGNEILYWATFKLPMVEFSAAWRLDWISLGHVGVGPVVYGFSKNTCLLSGPDSTCISCAVKTSQFCWKFPSMNVTGFPQIKHMYPNTGTNAIVNATIVHMDSSPSTETE